MSVSFGLKKLENKFVIVAELFLANRPLLFLFVLSPLHEFSSPFRWQDVWSAGRRSIKQLENYSQLSHFKMAKKW